ncbi:variable surface protein Vir14, putative [Plasmodium vivax]|uniref:Variable surface protein Vir14, putative n=1 Tax=Plasmodium vivax (strain Salvador I) TaxID=126793 RepID=A5KD02_PLAVS|nr:variable surface protein Vir14, putative [Plasmodium vivax]EDL42768.1 variable surface protein Vir14, putative [Plasmodium vivax]|eukprot:XP_001612561.1 variable surface protein Vir14 [Plasmodium vivax Sal-1]
MFKESGDIWNELDRLSLSSSGEFNSKYFYNELDELQDFKVYKENCKPLKGPPWRQGVINTCAKLLYYLKTSTKLNKKVNNYDVCPLLNYWVYNRLNMFLSSYDPSYIKETFGNIVQIWYKFLEETLSKPDDETCKPNYLIVVQDDWRYRKELYEYYVNYSPLRLIVNSYPDTCIKFYKYVESKKELYKYFKKRCRSSDENICPNFFAKCLQYDPEEVLSTLSCHENIMKERAAAAPSALQRVNAPSDSEPNSDVSDGRKMPDDAPILRGMIRNGLGWNTNNMSNINGGGIRLYDYASGPFNPYPGEEHNIGYHPA